MVRVALQMLALLLADAAQGAPECPPRPIRLAFYEYGMYYNQGSGVDQDVVEELKRRSGCTFDIRVLPRIRIWIDLESGEVDMATSAVETPERARIFWFMHYMQAKQYALVSKRQTAGVDSMEAFIATPGLRLAMGRGFKHSAYYDAALERLAAQGRIEVVTSADQMYEMLKNERVAGIIAGAMVFRLKLRELQMEDQVRVADWNPSEPPIFAGLVMPRRNFSEAQAKEWARLIDEMRRDGTMERLIGKYLSRQETLDSLIR